MIPLRDKMEMQNVGQILKKHFRQLLRCKVLSKIIIHHRNSIRAHQEHKKKFIKISVVSFSISKPLTFMESLRNYSSTDGILAARSRQQL